MSIESGTFCSLRIELGQHLHYCIGELKVYYAFYPFVGNELAALSMEVSCVGIRVGNKPLLVDVVIIRFLVELFFCT